MQYQSFVAFALFGGINALPLNINLGAYSPALVVGDGEISFGGKQDVSNLMNALEGAAVSGAAANGQAAPAAPVAAAVAQPATAGTNINPAQDTTQVTSLQGMGKEIAPRIVNLVPSAEKEKRDITGFNAALNYATGALKTSPEIQLGTGEGGSGVGITQKPGSAAASATSAEPAAAAREVLQRDASSVTGELVTRDQALAKEAIEKRDESAAPKMKTTVTTMFVRGGAVPAGNFVF
jgi:hypothetical protein